MTDKEDDNAKRASRLYLRRIQQEVSLPRGWVEANSDQFGDEYYDFPEYDHCTGSLRAYAWRHEDRDEAVELWIGDAEEGAPYGIQAEIDQAMYHGEGTDTLETAVEIASCMMYMMNHANSNNKRESRSFVPDANREYANWRQPTQAELDMFNSFVEGLSEDKKTRFANEMGSGAYMIVLDNRKTTGGNERTRMMFVSSSKSYYSTAFVMTPEDDMVHIGEFDI